MQTIYKTFAETATKFPNRPALKFKLQRAYISVTFAELKERVDVLARGLFAMGVRKGDRVAILSENRTEWVRTDLAALKLGAITVPVHTTLSSRLVKHILLDSQAKIILVSTEELYQKVAAVASELPDLTAILFLSLDHTPTPLGNIEVLPLNEVMRRGEQSDPVEEKAEEDDVASIIYTSGTTAEPKGVMLTHQNFMYNAEAAITIIPVTEKDLLLSFLPLSHVLERTCGYYAPLVCRGAAIAYAESVKTLKENFREVRPTMLVCVPRIFERIHKGIWDKLKTGNRLKYHLFIWALKQDPKKVSHAVADALVFRKIRHAFGGRLRMCFSGGATLNHKLARFFQRVGITIVEGYGLTETSPIITVNRPDNIKFGSVGQKLPGLELMTGADKEILVKGPGVMKGYYNNQTLTAQAIDENGWFHTGDLGFISSEGFLVIIGRKKEMICLSNGKIVWPEQLEITLDNDRFIAQSMVYGNDKSYLTALIVPDWSELNLNLDSLGLSGKEPDRLINDPKVVQLFSDRIEKINEQLADWEKIRRFALVTQEFSQTKEEVTPTLKLRRQKIYENNRHQIEALYGASS